ncbi:hypothetical protein PCAR4_390068 [Paraburkholderia caribensis]|nr:hypothetical protein PCAR4_390068 [Paraburkholderia caribensis]
MHKQPHLPLITTPAGNDFGRPETRCTINLTFQCAREPKSQGFESGTMRPELTRSTINLTFNRFSVLAQLTSPSVKHRQLTFLKTRWFVVLKSKPPHQPTGTSEFVYFQYLNPGKVRCSVPKVRFAVHEGECCCVTGVRSAVQQGEV